MKTIKLDVKQEISIHLKLSYNSFKTVKCVLHVGIFPKTSK